MVQFDEKEYGLSREKLSSVFDSGTFVELGAYVKREETETLEGVVCGYGSICGKLVFAFVQDSGRAKGAFDEKHSKKIAATYSLAVKNGAPIIGVFDSAGAYVQDGAAALAAYGKLMKCVSDASGVIPQIAIIDGVCGGSSAVVASMFDLVITVKDKSKLFVNAPFNVGQQSATAMGYSAYEAENGEDAYRFARELVLTLPENNTALAYVDTADDPCRATDVDLKSCDAATAVSTLADDGRFITLFEGYAENVKVGLASFGGILCGVVASDKKNGGALDVKSARVASKLLSFCDSFGIPVLTLVDSVGIEVSSEAEASSYASELARLAYAYTSSDNAKVSVVMGKAYGAAFTLLGSKSVGADIALALPDAKVSVLSPEASVAFLWNGKVGDKSREELEAEWGEKCASAKNACDLGEIDYIVEPCELRARICAAFSMLCAKAEGTPTRKHVNMPL